MISTKKIFAIENESDFERLALEIFRYQAKNVLVYQNFLSHLKRNPDEVTNYQNIPFLPVEFYKSHEIIVKDKKSEIIFESSSTTGSTPSKHYVASKNLYEESFLNGFIAQYGEPKELCILALLPSYLERSGSSLVYMAEKLIHLSSHPESGFYLNDHVKLIAVLKKLKISGTPTLLLGVSYALLDLAEKYQEDLSGIIIMETGGMKGRRKELVKEDLHLYLKKSFNVESIHSEYGMTELLSQAYSKGSGKFFCPPWMKVLIRDSYDPFQILNSRNTGGINIVDLANIYSCSFIASADLGRINQDESFEVLGRIDNSDIRGCNLMIE